MHFHLIAMSAEKDGFNLKMSPSVVIDGAGYESEIRRDTAAIIPALIWTHLAVLPCCLS